MSDWKRSKSDGLTILERDEYQIRELYEPVPDGRYELIDLDYDQFVGVGTITELKKLATDRKK